MKTFLVRCAIGILLTPLTVGLGAQTPKPSAQTTVVAALYADFACEAVLDEPLCDGRHQFVDQPKAVLAKYFDDQLVRLWLADRACAARTHQICNLDFSPIWDSQDPTGTVVRIVSAADSTHVDVELSRSSPASRVLRYTLVNTQAGWRIHDISKGAEWSLVKLLSGKTR